MCRLRFEIETATRVTTAKGRYRKVGASSWNEFSINLGNPQTPDIKEIGEYEMQIRVNNGKWQGNYPFSVKEDCGNSGGSGSEILDPLEVKCKKCLEDVNVKIEKEVEGEEENYYAVLENRNIAGCDYNLSSRLGTVEYDDNGAYVNYYIEQNPQLKGQTDTVTLTNCYGTVTKQVQIPKGDNENGGGTDNGGSTNADKPMMSFSRVICEDNEPKRYILKDWLKVGGLEFVSSPSSYIKGWKPFDDIGFEYELIFVSTTPNMQGRRITFETNKGTVEVQFPPFFKCNGE